MSFWGELKRRNVFKVALAYLVAAWLIVQIIGVLTNPLSLPETLDTVVVVLLAIGLPFALIIAWIYEVTPEGIKVTSPADSPGQAHRPTGARLTYVIIALLVTAVGLMALQNFVLTTTRGGFGEGSRIAVLPCDDLSPDPTDSFFAVGIHEELLNRLAALHGLEVISRTSVQQYAARRPPLPQIAKELDVDAILECSARYAGDSVRLTAQLIDGASDTHLWSQAYPADMSNLESLFEIQADIAMKVANALRVEFLEEEREQIAHVPTQSREAYELYLAGLNNTAPFESRLALLDQALKLDDQFIYAWIAKAQVHNLVAGFRVGNEADAERAAAIEAASTAVRIDPDSGPAHASLAGTLGQDGDWIGAELEARRALELGTPASIHFVKMAVGYFSEAAEALEDAVRKDPVNALAPGVLLHVYEALGDKAARRRHWERGELLFDAWFGWETESILRLGENDKEFLRTALPDPLVQNAIWSSGVANLDSPEDGLAAMRSLYANPEMQSAVNLRYLTAWALYFGDPSLALQWLRESIELQATGMFLVWLPSFTDLRREPDFKDLVRDVGLPEYWDQFGWPEFCRRIGNDDFECD